MGQQTADHVLQTCLMHTAAQDSVWPSPTSLEKTFYGSLGDLWATVAFVRETGLDISDVMNGEEEAEECEVQSCTNQPTSFPCHPPELATLDPISG